MLSTEWPPPDPPCSCQISTFKYSSRDEKASDKLLVEVEPDLPKSGLDDPNPPPKFSIRDFVYCARKKDISINWPFSQKSLQLCLKHGVKDLLPPFQRADEVRKPSMDDCIENPSAEAEGIGNSDGKSPVRPIDDQPLTVASDTAECSQRSATEFVNIDSRASEGNRGSQIPQSCREFYSVPTNRIPYFELEADILPDIPVPKPDNATPPAQDKTEDANTVQPVVKKCRLMVKLSRIADQTSNTETATDNTVTSEAIASKVCPVCKTFSSSSNTTLNAHIDQCLSGEPTVKGAMVSKANKYRIKPRKTRLMVDIYATARHCTLEELDRRNGTSWSSKPVMPSNEIQLRNEEKLQLPSPINHEKTGDDGLVYIDANGTKLRILSKSSEQHPSSSKTVDNITPGNLVKGDKRCKSLIMPKRKIHVQKYHKLHKHVHGQTRCSPRLHRGPEVDDDEKTNHSPQNNCEKNEQLKPQDCMKHNEPEPLIRWASSKRTGLRKKINDRDGHQNRIRNEMNGSMQVESVQSPSDDARLKRRCLSYSSESTPSCSREGKQMLEGSSSKRHGGFSSPESRICQVKKRCPVLSVCGKKRLRKDGSFVHEDGKDHSNASKHRALFSHRYKSSQTSTTPVIKSSHSVNAKPASGDPAFSLKAHKFSSSPKISRENLLSDSEKQSNNFKRKRLVLKKFSEKCISESDQRTIIRQEDSMENIDEPCARMENGFDKLTTQRLAAPRIRKYRGEITESEELDGSWKSLCPESHSNGNNDSFSTGGASVRGSEDTESDEDRGEDTYTRPGFENAVHKADVGFSKFHQPEVPVLSGSLGVPRDSPRFVDEFKMPYVGDIPSTEILGHLGERFTEDVFGKEVGGQDYFEVEPIPIPGPPGSYLPSPGHLSSEDPHGNSSLTASIVQSSEDLHDRDSEESPVSGTSTISHAILERSDSRVSENLYTGPPAVQDEGKDSMAASPGLERFCVNEAENNMETGPLKLDNPCCCSRKEGAKRDVGLNYHGTELLQQGTDTFVTQQTNGSGEPLKRLDGSDSSSEMLPEEKTSGGNEVNFRSSADCNPFRPSSSNPVLRLMGKNLLVVNKEDVYPYVRTCSPNTLNDRVKAPQFYPVSGVSSPIAREDDHQYPRPVVSRGPIIGSQLFDAGLSNSFIGSDSRFSSPNGGYLGSAEACKYVAGFYSPPLISPQSSLRPLTTSGMKDIIVIDDASETEADAANDVGMISGRKSSSAVPTSMTSGYAVTHINPLYGYQQQHGYPTSSGASITARTTSSLMPPPNKVRSSFYGPPGFS